ncbi:FkbM family methyltransferase [Microbaculum marinum]|uniref:FkbM family methyltransferase n=1 Tax=Microbaculum marinum TaxID=1764581 RepID=A0AAW9RRE4_9HYPH
MKKLLYGRRGEPYEIAGTTLRFVPGTRPIKQKYRTSPNSVARYDALQIEFMADALKSGDTALDVGAHVGQCTLVMAARCGPAGHVVAFEPDPKSRQLLLRNIALNPSVSAIRVEELALYDREGSAVLFSRGGDANSSLSKSAFPGSPAGVLQEVQVTVTTLDSYLDRTGEPVPKVVKIDAEGAEIRILGGAEKLLAGDSLVLCELHPYAWPGFDVSLQNLKTCAARADRRIRYLDQAGDLRGEAVYGTVLLEKR